MKNLALAHIQKMKSYKPPLADRRAYKGLLLDFNERTVPPSNDVILSTEQAIKNQNLQIYPEYKELERQTAKYAGVADGQSILTNGSDQAIEVIFRTFCEQGSKAVIPSPSFDMFFQIAGVVGCEIISPHYGGDKLAYPVEQVIDSIDKQTKLIIICNPNNPTGGLVSVDDIEKIAKKAKDSIVYVDEAYFEFSGVSAVGLIQKYPNIVVTRTFSKAFGLASLRVGYIIADQLYIGEMLKVRGPYPVNMAGYTAALAALKNQRYMQDYSDEVMTRAKPLVEKFFAANAVKFYPSSANSILFAPRGPQDVYDKLSAAGILLRPQAKPWIEGTLRLSIGTLKQMKQFCEIYEKVILK